MPGIAGIIAKMSPGRAEIQLAKMIASLRHGPLYTTGMWEDKASGVYVGWTAQNESLSQGRPVQDERGDVLVVFSGENYPEPCEVQHFKESGHDLNLGGPSYLVHLYEVDPVFPAGLNGRFHGLLADRSRGTALLFNDRYGMHRIYYHETADAFYFASEAKAILAVCPEVRRIDAQGLGEFLSCGAVLQNRTLFRGVQVLPPASAWNFQDGSLARKSTYFHPKEWEEQQPLDSEAYYEELRAVFIRNLPRYFGGHERIAMSLTGGLDTRMILACDSPDPGTLPCYTFGSMFRENQDVRVARQVAAICEQPHQVLIAGQEFLSQFPRYAERAIYLTDGCVDVSRAPDLYLNEIARQIAPVRMTGLYGGEILRGIRAFKPVEPTPGLFSPEFSCEMRQAASTYAEIARCHPVSFAAFRQNPWCLYGSLALEQTQLTVRTPFLDNDFVRTVFRSPPSLLASNETSLHLIADGSRALLGIPTDRGLIGNKRSLRGVASRGFLEFLFKAEYAYDMGMPQWLARLDHGLSSMHVERLFLGRHKPFHFRLWYRDALAGYIQEMLLDERSLSRPYIQRKGLEAVVRGHVKGNRNYTIELHKVIALELVHRLFLDSAEAVRPASFPQSGRLSELCPTGSGYN